MSEPSTEPDPLPGFAPVIPPPPPQQGRRPKGKGGDRVLFWFLAVIVGAALGAGAYSWAPGLSTYVDDWVALALG